MINKNLESFALIIEKSDLPESHISEERGLYEQAKETEGFSEKFWVDRWEYQIAAHEKLETILTRISDEETKEALREFLFGFLMKDSQGTLHVEKLDKLSQIEGLTSIDNAFSLCLKLSEEVSEVKKGALKILVSQEDKETYEGFYLRHFPEEFWSYHRQVFPPLMPNYISVFNFQTPEALSNGVSLSDLKNFVEEVKEALVQDFEILVEGKSEKEIEKLKKTLSHLFEDDYPLSQLLKNIINFQEEKERTEESFSRSVNFVQTFFDQKDLINTYRFLGEVKKKFPDLYGKSERIKNMEAVIGEAFNLQSQIYLSKGIPRARLIKQVRNLMGDFTPQFKEVLSSKQIREKEARLKAEINKLIEQQNWDEAYKLAYELSEYAWTDSYLLQVSIKTAKNKALDLPDSEVSEKPDTSVERRIKFWEEGILIAEATIKACEELKIPVDDSEYWQDPGKRVELLKKMGKYEIYKTKNKSNPNLPPKADPSTGMYFSWFDGRGDSITENQGESGVNYLKKAKETDSAIWALSGAFSFNWAAGDMCYTPREFIEKSKSLISQVRG